MSTSVTTTTSAVATRLNSIVGERRSELALLGVSLVLTFALVSLAGADAHDPTVFQTGSGRVTNPCGTLGAHVAHILRAGFGLGAWGIVLLLSVTMVRLAGRTVADWRRWLGALITYSAVLGLMHVVLGEIAGYPAGGALGSTFGGGIQGVAGYWGALFLLFGVLVLGGTALFRVRWRGVAAALVEGVEARGPVVRDAGSRAVSGAGQFGARAAKGTASASWAAIVAGSRSVGRTLARMWDSVRGGDAGEWEVEEVEDTFDPGTFGGEADGIDPNLGYRPFEAVHATSVDGEAETIIRETRPRQRPSAVAVGAPAPRRIVAAPQQPAVHAAPEPMGEGSDLLDMFPSFDERNARQAVRPKPRRRSKPVASVSSMPEAKAVNASEPSVVMPEVGATTEQVQPNARAASSLVIHIPPSVSLATPSVSVQSPSVVGHAVPSARATPIQTAQRPVVAAPATATPAVHAASRRVQLERGDSHYSQPVSTQKVTPQPIVTAAPVVSPPVSAVLPVASPATPQAPATPAISPAVARSVVVAPAPVAVAPSAPVVVVPKVTSASTAPVAVTAPVAAPVSPATAPSVPVAAPVASLAVPESVPVASVAPPASPVAAPVASVAPPASPVAAPVASVAPPAPPVAAPVASVAPPASPVAAPVASVAPPVPPVATPIASAAPPVAAPVAPVAPVAPIAPVAASVAPVVAPVAPPATPPVAAATVPPPVVVPAPRVTPPAAFVPSHPEPVAASTAPVAPVPAPIGAAVPAMGDVPRPTTASIRGAGITVHRAAYLDDQKVEDNGEAVVEEKKSFHLPTLRLLDEVPYQDTGIDEEELREMAATVEEKLLSFKIGGEVTAVRPGPVVTIFEFEPAPGIKVSRIAGLSDDLAMALRAVRVRIVAPIPGKGCVGIEIPSAKRLTIYLREVLASPAFKECHAALPCILGKDVGGKPVIGDLAKMPHLLIGGTTGAGKSVGVNGMLMSMLYTSSPDDLRMLLIDPKMLEFEMYEGIPHLLHPVVTDPKRAATALAWACREMDNRYEILARWGTRNIVSFNKKREKEIESWNAERARKYAPKDWMECDGLPEPPKHMPYIVIVIDELADLMMVASKEVEESIARIAQKARACGIHLIVATQRPSVDVVTGLIKANLPTRISFQLRTRIDSRTVLDAAGAEALLGRGDMLYLPPGTGNLVRCHGAFVSDEEVARVTDFLRAQDEPDYIGDITDESKNANGVDEDEKDELYDQAVQIVINADKASTSMVQRHLKIGYNRAARIIDYMEASGVIGPADGARPREVL